MFLAISDFGGDVALVLSALDGVQKNHADVLLEVIHSLTDDQRKARDLVHRDVRTGDHQLEKSFLAEGFEVSADETFRLEAVTEALLLDEVSILQLCRYFDGERLSDFDGAERRR